ncbi:MAG: hypothetical protein AAGK22_17520, partial [Acidobacteriota bacterium]
MPTRSAQGLDKTSLAVSLECLGLLQEALRGSARAGLGLTRFRCWTRGLLLALLLEPGGTATALRLSTLYTERLASTLLDAALLAFKRLIPSSPGRSRATARDEHTDPLERGDYSWASDLKYSATD